MVIGKGDSVKVKFKGQKPYIFIGIPTVDGNISIWNAINIAKWVANRDMYEIRVFPSPYMSPHDWARNTIIETFLQSECNYLFMLDTQTIPVAYYLGVMLAHNVDMVSAIAQVIQNDGALQPKLIPVAHRLRDGMAQPFWAKGLQECYWTTCACTLIKREVIKALELPAFVFGYNEYGFRTTGEDYNFCVKVQEAGFKIHVDFNLLCSHFKLLDMRLQNTMLLETAKRGVITDDSETRS